jgi:hypothetical protein
VEDLELDMDLEPEFDADPDRITKIKFDNYIDVDFVKTEPDLKNCQRFTKKMEKTFLSQLKKFRSGGFWSDLIYLFTNLHEAEEIRLHFTETIDLLPEYSFEFPVLKKLRSAKIHVDSFDLVDEDCFAYLFKIFSFSHLEILLLEVEYNFDVLPPPLFETKSLKVLSIFCMNQTDCTMDIPDLDFSNLMNSLVNLEEIYLDGCSHLDGSLLSQLIENPNLKKIQIIRRSTNSVVELESYEFKSTFQNLQGILLRGFDNQNYKFLESIEKCCPNIERISLESNWDTIIFELFEKNYFPKLTHLEIPSGDFDEENNTMLEKYLKKRKDLKGIDWQMDSFWGQYDYF